MSPITIEKSNVNWFSQLKATSRNGCDCCKGILHCTGGGCQLELIVSKKSKGKNLNPLSICLYQGNAAIIHYQIETRSSHREEATIYFLTILRADSEIQIFEICHHRHNSSASDNFHIGVANFVTLKAPIQPATFSSKISFEPSHGMLFYFDDSNLMVTSTSLLSIHSQQHWMSVALPSSVLTMESNAETTNFLLSDGNFMECSNSDLSRNILYFDGLFFQQPKSEEKGLSQVKSSLKECLERFSRQSQQTREKCRKQAKSNFSKLLASNGTLRKSIKEKCQGSTNESESNMEKMRANSTIDKVVGSEVEPVQHNNCEKSMVTSYFTPESGTGMSSTSSRIMNFNGKWSNLLSGLSSNSNTNGNSSHLTSSTSSSTIFAPPVNKSEHMLPPKFPSSISASNQAPPSSIESSSPSNNANTNSSYYSSSYRRTSTRSSFSAGKRLVKSSSTTSSSQSSITSFPIKQQQHSNSDDSVKPAPVVISLLTSKIRNTPSQPVVVSENQMLAIENILDEEQGEEEIIPSPPKHFIEPPIFTSQQNTVL